MTRQCCKDERGFSLIEAVVAVFLLSVGLLGLAAALTKTVTQTKASGADLVAKDKAYEVLENIFAARDSQLLEWNKLRNVAGGDGGGVFLDGEQVIHEPGADNIIGTTDDLSAPEQVIRDPGPNGELGDSDDRTTTLGAFKREIEIRRVNPSSDTLRQVRVIITYTFSGMTRRYVLTTLVSSYS